jgi:hypothetical protein
VSCRRHQLDDFICCHNGAGIVREVDVQSGLHLVIRVIRCRVLDYGDLVAELSGKADRCFDAGMRDQTDDDEMMDPCFLSCKSKSVLAKPLEHRCSVTTISPGLGSNSAWNSPPQVPYSKVLRIHPAF